MAAASAERDSAKMFRSSESCSVCLDAVCDSGERSIAKLKCGHHFHLDCIGSAFNAKGAMQCPNCRHVENGQWLYANGARWNDDFSVEDVNYEDDYEVYQTLPSLLSAQDTLTHLEWCPYQHGSLTPGGSSYEHVQFHLPFREVDGPARIPEVVVNVSYYNESGGGGAASSPVCPYLDTQVRMSSQSTDDSRLRPPQAAGGPTRPLDPSGASNSGSTLGSIMGDVDLFSRTSLWRPRRESLSSFSGHRADPSLFTDQTRFSDQIRSTPTVDFTLLPPHSSATLYPDTGSGPFAHDRLYTWPRNETMERASSQGHSLPAGPYNTQHSHNNESYTDGGSLPVGPCPRSRYAHGQVGTSQSQSQSSSLRSAPIGSNRRPRQSGIATPSSSAMSGGRTDHSLSPGELREDLRRALGPSWTDLSLSLGSEPPVPGLESHGSSGYQSGGQGGFVPPWRRESTTPSGPSSSLWTPAAPLWPPPTQSSVRYGQSDYIEGSGQSLRGSSRAQSDLDQYRSSLFSSFGLDRASTPGSSLPSQVHIPTNSYSIPLRPR